MSRNGKKSNEQGQHRAQLTSLEGHLAELRSANWNMPSPERPGMFAEWCWMILTDAERHPTKRQRSAIREVLLHAIETAAPALLDGRAAEFTLACEVLRKSVNGDLAQRFAHLLVESVPTRGEFWTELGRCEESLQQWSAARDAYQRAWALVREGGDWDEEAGCRLASALIECRQFDDAATLLTDLVSNAQSTNKAKELLRIANSPSARV